MQLSISLGIMLSLLTTSCMVGGTDEEDAAAGDGVAGETAPDDGVIASRVCSDGATVFGIDVSHHQGTIDWPRAQAAGVKYAFVRVSDGANTRDRSPGS